MIDALDPETHIAATGTSTGGSRSSTVTPGAELRPAGAVTRANWPGSVTAVTGGVHWNGLTMTSRGSSPAPRQMSRSRFR